MGMRTQAHPVDNGRLIRVVIGRKPLLITRSEAIKLRMDLEEALRERE